MTTLTSYEDYEDMRRLTDKLRRRASIRAGLAPTLEESHAATHAATNLLHAWNNLGIAQSHVVNDTPPEQEKEQGA